MVSGGVCIGCFTVLKLKLSECLKLGVVEFFLPMS